MNIRDLRYIVEVARSKNFARAAENCFVSQPALSMQIKKLEDELGVKIFERNLKKFLVTEIGKEIIKKAEVILHEEQSIKNLAKTAQDPLGGELRIGAFPTLASYFFPDAVKNISKKFPKIKLFLVEEKTEILIEKLKKGEIDIAFLAIPIADSDLEYIKIFSEKFLLASSKNHELAKKKKISSGDLKGKNLMLLEDGHCLRGQALEACSMFGAFEEQNFRASSLETLREMIKAGNGITFIPEIAAKKDDKISYTEIANAPTRSIGLYFRKSFIRKELAEEIAKLSRQTR
jgi:LysR family hydrogen peroxide-inducible transcriptional activator